MELNQIDSPAEYDELPEERKQFIQAWIRKYLNPINTFNRKHTSYGLKHLIEKAASGNQYFTNGEFKGAMLAAGYEPLDPKAQNLIFKISEKSPGLRLKHER